VLAERAGRVLSREQLLDLAKGTAEESFDRSIDVHVSRLRQKLGDDGKRPRLLKTVRGAGYARRGRPAVKPPAGGSFWRLSPWPRPARAVAVASRPSALAGGAPGRLPQRLGRWLGEAGAQSCTIRRALRVGAHGRLPVRRRGLRARRAALASAGAPPRADRRAARAPLQSAFRIE
jgi:hypothetical protein